MKRKKRLTIISLLSFGVFSSAFILFNHRVDAQESINSSWIYSCMDAEKTHCAVVQKVAVAETGQRVIEFSVSNVKNNDNDRGVMILPLGVLVQNEIVMTIDEGVSYGFKINHCNSQGCFAYLDMSPEMIKELKRGNELNIYMVDSNRQPVQMRLSLKGFTKAYKKLS